MGPLDKGTDLRRRTVVCMDLSLRARVRNGDPRAFGELFDECSRAVYNHAFRLVGDWSSAEDVMSLTFLEAWRLRDRIDAEGGSLRPWLLGIATNVARNTRRAAWRHGLAMGRLPRHQVEVPDFADEVVERMVDAERVAAVLAAFRRLRRSDQDVLALCVWAGLDYAEAAEALNIPVGTVKSRLSRARRRLLREPAEPLRQVEGDRESAIRLPREALSMDEERR